MDLNWARFYKSRVKYSASYISGFHSKLCAHINFATEVKILQLYELQWCILLCSHKKQALDTICAPTMRDLTAAEIKSLIKVLNAFFFLVTHQSLLNSIWQELGISPMRQYYLGLSFTAPPQGWSLVIVSITKHSRLFHPTWDFIVVAI